ncbi:MAG: hypothetical protein KDK41_16210 [Leptospiraceae bacterium]|nr:hypothetical protein [Leptospiraceae bacterium]
MGRTLIPYSRQIQIFEERMSSFRRGLRRSDQLLFDQLLSAAKIQVAAGAMAASPDPDSSIFISIAIELKRENLSLSKRLEVLECKLQKDTSLT